jgi:hypothetical protein
MKKNETAMPRYSKEDAQGVAPSGKGNGAADKFGAKIVYAHVTNDICTWTDKP